MLENKEYIVKRDESSNITEKSDMISTKTKK